MQYSEVLQTVYKTGSDGALHEWTIRIDTEEDGSASFTVVHGHAGGKLQRDVTRITEGKNLGKTNATTPLEQALFEARSRRDKQIRMGYCEQQTGPVEPKIGAMLAHDGTKMKLETLAWPMKVQPKYDGMRCLSYLDGAGGVVMMTRGHIEYKGLDHIRFALQCVLRTGDVLDGELYNHELHDDFGTLSSKIKRGQQGTENVQYHVYDMVSGANYDERYRTLLQIIRPENPIIKLVPTYSVNDPGAVMKYHDFWVERGYEGAMLRVGDCMYKAGFRSRDLLKIKSFKEDEFKIIRVEECRGRAEGQAKLWCATKDGLDEFSTSVNGTDAYRKELLQSADEIIGKSLTVRHLGIFQATGKPRMPKGIAVREIGH